MQPILISTINKMLDNHAQILLYLTHTIRGL
jgi:hypothetical protein